MLNLLSEAAFGDVQKVFTYEGEHEGWVDRWLNVPALASHNRYFADMMKVHVVASLTSRTSKSSRVRWQTWGAVTGRC